MPPERPPHSICRRRSDCRVALHTGVVLCLTIVGIPRPGQAGARHKGGPRSRRGAGWLDAASERGRTRSRRCLAHLVVLTYNRVVVGTGETERADALFHAMADPTRRDILALVLQDAHSVSDLARRYPISFAAVHKHVGALERAGLVTKTRHGREQRVRGNVATLQTAHRLLDDLEALWRGRIDRIEQVLAHPTQRAPQ
jgi:DNA-binding transcriptional ArsR family regulator